MGIERIVFALVLASGPLWAQRAPADAAVQAKPYIEATGEAAISAKPDQLIIEFGVVTQNNTAANAAADNAKQTDAALAEMRKLIGAGDQVKTTGYSVRPNYRSPKPGSAPTIDGYIASNTVQVTLADLTLAGKIIDTVLQSGVNNIQRLQFGLKNPQAARSQALKQAAIQARANADAIADGLGVHIVRVLSAQEGGISGEQFRTQGQAAALASTQIEPGTIDVHVTVTLRAEVNQ